MRLEPEHLAAVEIRLDWTAILRIFSILFIPLFGALLLNSIILKVILWGISAAAFWVLLRLWGHSVIAVLLTLVPVYAYFEWENAPGWLAYVVAILAVSQIVFISKRVKEIRGINRGF